MTFFNQIGRVVLIAVFVWLVIIMAVLTPLANFLLPSLIAKSTGREMTQGSVLIDPFEVRLLADDLVIAERDGTPRIALGRFEANVATWASIQSGHIVLEEVVLEDFQSRAATVDETRAAIDLAELRIDRVEIALDDRTMDIAAITFRAPAVRADFIDGVTQISALWADLLPGEATNDAPPEAPEPIDAPAWSAAVKQFSIHNGSAGLYSDLTNPRQSTITDLALTVDNVRWPDGEPRWSFSALLNGETSLASEGELALGDGAGKVDIDINGLELARLQPLLAQQLRADIEGGRLVIAASAALTEFAPQTAAAEVTLERFILHPPEIDAPATRIARLKVSEIALDTPASRLDIGAVDISGLETYLHIFPDGAINLLQIEPVAAERDAASDASTDAATPAQAPATDPAGSSPEWRVVVPMITLNKSQLDFRDDTLPVQFTAHIDELHGELAGLDTQSDTAAEWQLEGNIDGYAPVTITGKVGHFSNLVDGAFKFETRGVDLSRLAPYSATYAGYPIERGVMALSLDYQLADRKLQGENHLRIDQLALGDKQPSERQVIDLPLRTAVALLSNAAGAIEIDIPVAGGLDNPEFNVLRAARSALVNLLTNIVTAPFKFLASLVGSDEAPDNLRFAPGDAELTDTARSVLSTLGKALKQRPRITLSLNPSVDRVRDATALARRALRADLRAAGVTDDQITQRGDAWTNAINALAESAGLEAQPNPEDYVPLLLDLRRPDEAALKDLALQRASAVKSYLVSEAELDAQRAAIAPIASDAPNDSLVKMEIGTR